MTKGNSGTMQRQGDILIIRIDELPEEFEEKARIDGQIILAYGEVTGHKHAVKDIEVKWFGDIRGEQVLQAEQPFTLVHEEHAPLTFAPGLYRVIRQYEATADDLRQVLD